MAGVIIGPVDDWTKIYPGEKGKQMNRRRREIAAMPWLIDYESGPCSYKYDAKNNLVQKMDGYLQYKGEGTGTYGHTIPHTIVDYKDGVPAVVRSYNVEENHERFQEAKKTLQEQERTRHYDQSYETFYDDFHQSYAGYDPVVTYFLPDRAYWSTLKNEKDTRVILHTAEEFAATASTIDIVTFKDPYQKKGFWQNLRELVSSPKNEPAAPIVIKRARQDAQTLEYR